MRLQKAKKRRRAPKERESPPPRDALSLRDAYRMSEPVAVAWRRSPPTATAAAAPPPASIIRTTSTTEGSPLEKPQPDATIPHDPVSVSVEPTERTTEEKALGEPLAIGLARPLSSRDLRVLRAQKARESVPILPSQTSHWQQYRTSTSTSNPILPSFPRRSTEGSKPPVSLVWGAQHWLANAQDMESPRPRTQARPASSGSIVSGRSSHESRAKSPLSISSSVDSYKSSRTSVESYASANMASFHKTVVPVYGNGYTAAPRPQPVQRAHPADARIPPTTLVMPPRLGPQKTTVVGAESFGFRYAKRTSGYGFSKLPEEILLVILKELRKLHVDVGSLSCATCWMRDCCNLGISSKKWWSAAKSVLYEDIQLIGCDSVLQTKKKFKMKYGTRLKLLRRTLRSRPDHANYVKVLKVPSIPEAALTQKDKDEYMDLVASIIMSCPNLERLPGLYPTYKHEFSRFVHALSTRTKLVEQAWFIDPSLFQRQHRFTLSEASNNLYPALAPGPLLPEQCIDFLDYHSNWDDLQTLFLHCNAGGMIDSDLITGVTMSLPSLQNLHVSSFPAPAFNDETLVSLPPLKSLRLDSLPGVTSDGLSTYASLPTSNTLINLSLISLPLRSLPVLARLMSRLSSLKSLTISQASSPSLPNGTDIFMHPYLASLTLEYLHWEITSPLTDTATDILAKSIEFQGFPSLRTLRAPTDYQGALQALCKPRYRIELPGDRYRNLTSNSHRPVPTHSQTLPIMPLPSSTTTRPSFFGGRSNSSQNSLVAPPNPAFTESPTESTFSFNKDKEEESIGKGGGRSLAQARRQAQARIEEAQAHPKFHIIVWDEQGQFAERHAVAGFLGSMESKIYYSLKPDIEGRDEAVVRAPALLEGGEETMPRDGCTGSWNIESGKGGKGRGSGKEKWWHTERGRWREVEVKKFF